MSIAKPLRKIYLYQFIPDLRMAQSWERMTLVEEINSDEVLLKHEILESELVINQGMNQLDGHKI